ncbi:Anthocyanidin 3-O-glucoside 2''-O-glucosyltransferase [Bertholletia excelsa]
MCSRVNKQAKMAAPSFHIAMYPWFAMGHLTPFLHLSNKLAKKGHRISFLIPTNTRPKLEHFNLHPDLINFVTIAVPHVEGLPPGAETTADAPFPLQPLLVTAMDRTESHIECLLHDLRVEAVFFDFTHWMPRVAQRLGIKCIHYCIVNSGTIGYTTSPEWQRLGREETPEDLMHPPPGYPYSSVKLHTHEARSIAAIWVAEFGSGMRFCDRLLISFSQCDAIAFRTCREIEGPLCDYLETQMAKPVLLLGPVLPEPPTSPLEEKWANWLSKFNPGSIIYCAFGSECILRKDQFQELVLGLELTGLPFLAVLKPPIGAKSVASALPEGFEDRVEGRGVVQEGWVQQQLILDHPSVGCFITHCGWGSMCEALLSKCQLVLLPNEGDRIINARILSLYLKVGVEVEKGEEDGLFTRQSVCKAVRIVMDEDSEIAKETRVNHAKLREVLSRKDLETSYIDDFNMKLQNLLG